MDIQEISSPHNATFKAWKKLLSKKGREKQGRFIVEGEHLVLEAAQSKWPLDALIVSEEYGFSDDMMKLVAAYAPPIYTIPESMFLELADTDTPQGVMMVVQKPSMTHSIDNKNLSLLLAVDQVRDPGNLGTIIRTADAAGVDAILLGKGTADAFSGKVVRATQGSLFHIPLLSVDLQEKLSSLKSDQWCIIGTNLNKAKDIRQMDTTQHKKMMIIVGNEAEGVSESLEPFIDEHIKIPIFGQAESLNVGIATGILLYQIQFNRGEH